MMVRDDPLHFRTERPVRIQELFVVLVAPGDDAMFLGYRTHEWPQVADWDRRHAISRNRCHPRQCLGHADHGVAGIVER